MARVFGTDGVRGIANVDLTPELAFRLGRAGAYVLSGEGDPMKPFVVGRDTRLSGTMLEAALVAGITSTGRDTVSVGIVPTPGIPRIVASIGAAGGVMARELSQAGFSVVVLEQGPRFTAADFGKAMGKLKAQVGNSADGSLLAKILKEKLK